LIFSPYLGRLFHPCDENGANSAPYIVLTHAYWHSHFHDDPGVVGSVVQVNKNPFTIVGVAPLEFHGTLVFFFPDFFVPIVNQEQLEGKNNLNERGTAHEEAVPHCVPHACEGFRAPVHDDRDGIVAMRAAFPCEKWLFP